MLVAESTTAATSTKTADAAIGSLLGTAIGDALGLPYENLSPRRARKLFGPPTAIGFSSVGGLSQTTQNIPASSRKQRSQLAETPNGLNAK